MTSSKLAWKNILLLPFKVDSSNTMAHSMRRRRMRMVNHTVKHHKNP